MEIRDRVVEMKRVRASDLIPHPLNWRQHPQKQQDAVAAILDEVGIVDALKVFETPDGYQLIDGHLRRDLTGDQEVPVLVVNVSDDEAKKILATFDPLTSLASIDSVNLRALLDDVETASQPLADLLESVAKKGGLLAQLNAEPIDFDHAYQVVIDVADEDEQAELLDRLTAEGLTCRALMS